MRLKKGVNEGMAADRDLRKKNLLCRPQMTWEQGKRIKIYC